MKKTILINYLGRTGAGPEYAYEMAKGFLDNGCKVHVILSKDVYNLSCWKELPIEGMLLLDTYKDMRSFIKNTVLFLFQASRLIRTYFDIGKIDVCYVPMIQPWSFIVNRIFRKAKIVVTVHDPKPHKGSNFIFDFICWVTAKQADKLVILSKTFVEFTSRRYRFKTEDILVVPHGSFSNYISKAVNNKEGKLFNFLFFGRITKYKGLELLAQAYDLLFKERQDISLTIAGSGDFSVYSSMFDLSKNVQVVNRYILDDEISSFFNKDKTITVVPYTEATQSGVIPIAMKERSLVVCTNVGGLLEQTSNGECAIVCEPSVDGLYNAMKASVQNYHKYNSIIEKAHLYIESMSSEKLTKIILDNI